MNLYHSKHYMNFAIITDFIVDYRISLNLVVYGIGVDNII